MHTTTAALPSILADSLWPSPSPPPPSSLLLVRPPLQSWRTTPSAHSVVRLRRGTLHEEEDKWDINEGGWKERVQKKKEPNIFSGGPSKDIDDARSWVRDVDAYMDLYLSDIAGKRQEGKRLQYIVHQTSGVAKQWVQAQIDLSAKMMEMNMIKKSIEWVDVKDKFIDYFEGPQYRKLLEMQMKLLRLGYGKTKTLQAFNWRGTITAFACTPLATLILRWIEL